MNNLFLIASRKKYRFTTNKGQLATEDLWDLSLTSLDTIAKTVNKQLKETAEESFIASRRTGSEELENKLEILKYVIEVKMLEAEAAKSRVEKAQKLMQLKGILAQKTEAALSDKSVEDLQKMIAELEA